jgi:hypothetical protein
MKSDAAIIMIIFLAVLLATMLRRELLFKFKAATQLVQSTGETILDEVYQDYPELDPRR